MTQTGPDPEAPALSISLFGPFAACLKGEPLPRLRSRKGQWLLALLTFRHGREVERAWLAGTLWPDSSEPLALASLRKSLKDLRRALGAEAGRLRSPTPHSLCLDLAGVEADVVAFDAAVARGDVPSLEQAVALYRGPLLEGCEEEWAFQERQVREQAYLTALETLAADAMARGEEAAAERQLRQALAVDPLRETTQRALMQALAAGGNYAAATEAYRELRLLLHRELNAVPDPETQALFQQIRAEARRRAQAPARSLTPSTGNGGRPGEAEPCRLNPEGTVTFLFTDIESSTRLWEQHPEAMRAALARHDALLRQAIGAHDGTVFKTFGDHFCAAFGTASDALAGALAAQRALHAEPWPLPSAPLRVRMALHTGTVEERDGDYFGPPLNRVARLLDAAHGGQILLSLATAELVRDRLPQGADLLDLGQRRLRDLIRPEQIFQLLTPDLPADFPPLRSLEAFPHNLPLQLTSFIGREEPIEEVKRLLASRPESGRPPWVHGGEGAARAVPLLTLTGTGGCGKTRLALQVAADLLEEYPDGVWFVELAPLADPALVPQSVAATLGVREEPGRPLTQILAEYVKSRQLLLVLDNCEHLLEACAQLAAALLQACPRLRILATSREALGIAGETPYRVPSLSLPDPGHLPALGRLTQCEAVRLFIERAVTVLPTFTVTHENAPAVAQVCQRLDGIPLAIELAAARVKALPVEKINARLDDRFRLLTGGNRTALPRHQTLRALIDWSYDLLTEEERKLLRRLSVFAGGWTLEAAEAVCSGDGMEPWEVLDLLTQLVEKSLVIYEERAGEERYRLLETVRQYARDRLLEAGEAEEVREHHLEFFLHLAEHAEPHLTGPEQVAWLEQLESEHDNLRAALSWCQTPKGSVERGARLAGALWWFWLVRSHITAGREWLEFYLSQELGASPSARAKVLNGAGYLARIQGHNQQAEALCLEALAIYQHLQDERGIAWALNTLAYTAEAQGNKEEALQRCEESLALWRKLGHAGGIGYTLHQLGGMLRSRGERERAKELANESLKLFRALQDKRNMAISLWLLAHIAIEEGNKRAACTYWEETLLLLREIKDRRMILSLLPELAGQEEDLLVQRSYFAEGLQLAQEMDAKKATGQLLGGMGLAAAQQGEYPRARGFYEQSLAVRQELGDVCGIAKSLDDFAGLAVRQQQWERAARLLGAAACVAQTLGRSLAAALREEYRRPALREEYQRTVDGARSALGEAAFAAAWAAGQALTLERAIEYALLDSSDNGPGGVR